MDTPSPKVTIHDVARQAGVSISSVSRALSDHPMSRRRCASVYRRRQQHWTINPIFWPNGCGRQPQRRLSGRVVQPPQSFGHLRLARQVERGSTEFFLSLDDHTSPLQLQLQPRILALQARYLRHLRVRLAPAFAGLQLASAPLYPPTGQVRRKQSFSAQQGAHLTRMPAPIGLFHRSAALEMRRISWRIRAGAMASTIRMAVFRVLQIVYRRFDEKGIPGGYRSAPDFR